jgi:hypothetical protein
MYGRWQRRLYQLTEPLQRATRAQEPASFFLAVLDTPSSPLQTSLAVLFLPALLQRLGNFQPCISRYSRKFRRWKSHAQICRISRLVSNTSFFTNLRGLK